MIEPNASLLVKVIFKGSEETIPLSNLVSEEEDPTRISDPQMIERAAIWLNQDVSEFSNYVVSRPETGNIVISPKTDSGVKEEVVTPDHKTIAAEVRVEYQASDIISADEVVAEDISNQSMAQIEAAANRKDSQDFAQLVEKMEWESQPAEHLIQVIDLAMSLGYLPLARQLAEKGWERFPTNEVLAQTARALAPPVVRGFRPAAPGLTDTVQWMKKHAAEYKGQWIAVRSGELLATASSLPELVKAVGGLETLTGSTFVHRVL
jgi:hypothetical protein